MSKFSEVLETFMDVVLDKTTLQDTINELKSKAETELGHLMSADEDRDFMMMFNMWMQVFIHETPHLYDIHPQIREDLVNQGMVNPQYREIDEYLMANKQLLDDELQGDKSLDDLAGDIADDLVLESHPANLVLDECSVSNSLSRIYKANSFNKLINPIVDQLEIINEDNPEGYLFEEFDRIQTVWSDQEKRLKAHLGENGFNPSHKVAVRRFVEMKLAEFAERHGTPWATPEIKVWMKALGYSVEKPEVLDEFFSEPDNKATVKNLIEELGVDRVAFGIAECEFFDEPYSGNFSGYEAELIRQSLCRILELPCAEDEGVTSFAPLLGEKQFSSTTQMSLFF